MAPHSVTDCPVQSSEDEEGVDSGGDVIMRGRLSRGLDDTDWVKGCTKLVVEGTAPASRPRYTTFRRLESCGGMHTLGMHGAVSSGGETLEGQQCL